jgi:isochorismate synthase
MTVLDAPDREASPRTLVATAVTRDPVDPVALFAGARAAGLDASLWLDTTDRRSIVGIDVAMRLCPGGSTRFARLAEEWRAIVDDLVVDGPAAGTSLAGPLLLGGAAFRDHGSGEPRWDGFGSTSFDLPRMVLVSRDGESVLTTIHVPGSDAPDPGLIRQLADAGTRVLPATSSISPVGLDPERAAWSSSVARITGAVGRGRLDKVVLARRVDLRADGPLDPVGILRQLASADRADPSPGERLPSTVFAFGRGPRTFLGSTPERLASVRGRSLRTMALAGTCMRGTDAAHDAALGATLLASEKEREEHAVVVTMLRETLSPITTSLDVPRTPRIVRSARLQHLLTDVSGSLHEGVGALDVIGRLHPTPAVGGWPTQAALELLDEESTLDRGWYAGPVGWLGASGDGDLSVAIRSGLVNGSEVSLYAGCGIVADSEPDREWEESSLKLRVMGGAIGWAGG